MKNKWVILALCAGGVGGVFLTANSIEILKPLSAIITAGSGFIAAIVAYLVTKANKPVAK